MQHDGDVGSLCRPPLMVYLGMLQQFMDMSLVEIAFEHRYFPFDGIFLSFTVILICGHFSWYWRCHSSMISRFTVTPRSFGQGWRWHTAYPFTQELGVVFEVDGISTSVFRHGNSPAGRPHWRGDLSFNGHQPQNRNGPPGRPLSSAVSCRLNRLPSRKRVCRTQEVVTPHKGENKENEGESFYRLFCSQPPSLVWLPFGVFLSLHCRGPTG